MLADQIISHERGNFGASLLRYAARLRGTPRAREIAEALYPRLAEGRDWDGYAEEARPIFETAVRAYEFPADSSRIATIKRQAADRQAFLDDLCKHYMKRNEKFCLIEPWLNEKIVPFAFLNLDRSEPLRVLDLGCAVGHFSLLCEAAGHRVTGVDIDEPLFFRLSGLLGLDCRVDPVHPRYFQEAATAETYDLITGFLVNFNMIDERNWDAGEWDSFLEGAKGALNPGGRICFLLNTQTGRPGLKAHDGSLQRHLLTRGFKIFENTGFYAGPRLCLYRHE